MDTEILCVHCVPQVYSNVPIPIAQVCRSMAKLSINLYVLGIGPSANLIDMGGGKITLIPIFHGNTQR